MADNTGGVLTMTIRIRPGCTQYDLTDSLNDFLRSDDVYALIDDVDDDGWAYTYLPNRPEPAPVVLRRVADQLSEEGPQNG